MTQNHTPRRWPIVLAVFALVYLVAVVFCPILGFSFIELDVKEQVLLNPYIRGLTSENLKHIFTKPCLTSYYPVRTLTLALDYQLWGLNPRGYKLTGGLIHLTNVLLVFGLVLRLLRYPGAAGKLGERPRASDIAQIALAAFSAGIFAVHPVVVEPVTWVSGREELLMTLGALACFHFHLGARNAMAREGGRSGRATVCFLAAAFFCAFGCLSNAVGAVIPALITAWDLLTLPKRDKRTGRFSRILGSLDFASVLRGTFVLWLIGITTIVVKILRPGVDVQGMPLTIPPEQPFLILSIYWLNLGMIAWPERLTLSYPEIIPDTVNFVHVALGGVAITATCILLWRVRRHKQILFGLLWFCIALAPASHVVPNHLLRADRFLYLPLVGLVVAAAMALWNSRRFAKRPAAVTASATAGVALLVLLNTLSTRQVHRWQSDVSFWEYSATVVPDNVVFLADALQSAGEIPRAREAYVKALELDSGNVRILNNFAICLTSGGGVRLDDHRLAVELAERGYSITRGNDPGLVRTLARAHTVLANSYKAVGQYRLAIDHNDKAIETHPEYEMAFFNQALLLSTCRDRTLREPDAAVELAERGCELADPLDAERLGILATAYGEAGRFEEAIAATQRAIKKARESGDRANFELFNEYLQLFQSGLPLTAPPQGSDEEAQ